MNHAMIIGATGITGGYILNEIAGRDGWTVTGLCRNPPDRKVARQRPLDRCRPDERG